MSAPLLILLVGELTAPLQPHLEAALPGAFRDGVPEVGRGAEAPAGRTVAWVTQAMADEVVLTLHTARVPGDLRRELRFMPTDGLPERARTLAFSLAVMVQEREAALAPREVTPAEVPAPEPPHWAFSVRGLALIGVPSGAPGGGGLLEGQRLLPGGLGLGVGAELSASSSRGVELVQPALWAQVSLRLGQRAVVPRLALGAGAMASIITRGGGTQTVWQPLFRAAADFTWRFWGHHGLCAGFSSHLATASIPVGGGGNVAVGPMWVRLELGYVVDL